MKNFPPNLVILVVVLILIGVSVVVFNNSQKNKSAASPSESSSPSISPSPILEESASPSAVASVEKSPLSSSIPDKTLSPTPNISSLEQFIYPGAKVISSTSLKLEMESNQDAGKITDWYKEKIRQMDFNAKSFSQTNTNGIIFNILSAAKPGEKIEISIKKDQTVSNVFITVDRP